MRVICSVAFVDKSFDAALAAGLGFGPETAFLKGAQHDDSLHVILQVLEDEAATSLDDAVTHHSAANSEVGCIEANNSAVCEFKRAGAPQAWNKGVSAHLTEELVVAGHFKAALGTF